MQHKKRGLILGLAAGLFITAGPSRAHNEKVRSKTAGATKKEQKDWGIAGDASAVQRNIEVRMLDTMRFEPNRVDVRLGETLRFVARNTGKVMHEFVIGTEQENKAHAALMMKFPAMEHDAPYMAHVPPGKSGQIVWHFNRPGEFEFACLIAGHYQGGMVGKVLVAAA